MRRVRIESDSHDLIAGFVAGVEWVNDSAVAVVDLVAVIAVFDAAAQETVATARRRAGEGR